MVPPNTQQSFNKWNPAWLLLVITASTFGAAHPLRAQDKPDSVEATGKKLVTPEAQRSIDRGLAFLVQQQNADDGSFGSGVDYQRNVAVTSLCGMAFLAAGHTPGRGKYGRVIQKAVDFILSRCQPNGFIVEKSSMSHGPMYGHGFATTFLAEVYGMASNEQLRPKLQKAVHIIVNSQNKEGGWRYQPEPVMHADLSVTVCQIMALRAARNAGMYVPKGVIDRSVDYVKRSQNGDGGFRYQLVRREQSEFPRSAAALVALYNAGIYEGPEIEKGLAFLKRRRPLLRFDSHYYYGHYYAVQAMWHAGGDYWASWYPSIRDELITKQIAAEGRAWPDALICDEYATAMACLILQTPNNYLPIFQR